ncbi:MAG: carboxypeptidase regulatory-like domain-containing protein [Acidobacteria bacterium]|nr:carboxypeptidase regulatory-like domain-containing protein [Acidobacteriota bacterium]
MHHMRPHWLVSSFSAVATLLLASTLGWSQQVSGSIGGTILDKQGAVIPSAKVVLTDVNQGDQRETVTNAEGIFFFNPLKPSVYSVRIEASGFSRFERKEVKVFANDRIDLGRITLEVGAVTESIVVEAKGEEIKTTGAERSGVLNSSQVVNLALLTRDFLQLTRTLPGVVQNGGIGGAINGNRNNANNLTVDGVTNIDTGSNGGVLATMNMDQIAEFKVLTNAAPAEFGRSSGAQINVITKSGSRDFHGTGYLFHRHEGLNANNWLNNQQPQANGQARSRQLYRYNFAGFNAGGPVLIPKTNFNKNRDKLFFFVGMEWQQQLAANSLRNVTVPTEAQRRGDFSQTREGDGRSVFIRDPLSGLPCATNSGGAGCFPGNIIPASRINPDGQKILNFYPTPNANDNQFNYQTQVSDQFPRRENVFRGDYNINEKWRLYSRYMYTVSSRNMSYGQWSADYNIPYAPMNFGNPGWSLITNLTTIVNPTLTNEFIFGSSKNVLNIDPVDKTFDRAKLSLSYKMPFPDADKLALVQNWRYGGVPNAPFTGFNGTPFRNFNHTWDITDNISKVWGTHTLKGGFYLHKSQKDQTAFTSVNGDIWFDRDSQNPGDTNWAYSNAIVGNFQRLAQSNVVLNGQYRSWNAEFYVQDSWRVNSKFTLDYGIRFYWIQPQYDAALQTSSFNPALYNLQNTAALIQPALVNGAAVGVNPVTGAVVPRALISSIVNTGKGFVNGLYANGMGLAGKDGYPAGLLNNRGLHYAPRVGFAYQFLPRTVLRAGGGFYYDRFQGNPVFDMLPNPPSTNRPTFYFGNLNQIANLQGTYFPGDVRGFDVGGHLPTTLSYNISIQREIKGGFLLDAGYVGTRGWHLLNRFNVNALPLRSAWLPQNQDPTVSNPTSDGRTAKMANLYRPYPGYQNVPITQFGAVSNYNALQVQLNRNFRNGLQFGAAYTWSKTLGIANGDQDELHPFNYRMGNYGYLDYDVPHILVLNYVYEIPKLARSSNFLDNKVGRTIVNGWMISGITTFQQGFPGNIGLGFSGIGGELNRVYTGSENVGPRVSLAGNPITGSKAIDAWIDTSVFRAPLVGSAGLESARYIVRRPGINNWDISVFKNVSFTESRFLQLRFEMFNAWNHTQFSDFNRSVQFDPRTGAVTNLPTSRGGGGGRYGFGAINSVRDPRFVQLAAKFYF